jgi:putative transposase
MHIETDEEETYDHLDHLICRCLYHVIFCPKYRRRVLVDGVDERLKELILEKQAELQFKVVELEVMPDHVHLLLKVNPKIGIFKVVCALKGYTSRVLRQEFPVLRSKLPTLWTRSKFISTVGSVSLSVVKRYIEDQRTV